MKMLSGIFAFLLVISLVALNIKKIELVYYLYADPMKAANMLIVAQGERLGYEEPGSDTTVASLSFLEPAKLLSELQEEMKLSGNTVSDVEGADKDAFLTVEIPNQGGLYQLPVMSQAAEVQQVASIGNKYACTVHYKYLAKIESGITLHMELQDAQDGETYDVGKYTAICKSSLGGEATSKTFKVTVQSVTPAETANSNPFGWMLDSLAPFDSNTVQFEGTTLVVAKAHEKGKDEYIFADNMLGLFFKHTPKDTETCVGFYLDPANPIVADKKVAKQLAEEAITLKFTGAGGEQ